MCHVQISRSLAARVGTQEAHVGVRDGETVRDVIERMADLFGSQVEKGMLDGDRLRSDVIAVRNPEATQQPVTADSTLSPADSLEFHLTSEHEKVSDAA